MNVTRTLDVSDAGLVFKGGQRDGTHSKLGNKPTEKPGVGHSVFSPRYHKRCPSESYSVVRGSVTRRQWTGGEP